MKFSKNQILEVKISDVNLLGLGVAKVDGAVIFVQNGVTEDVCRIQIIKCAKNYYVARIEELLVSSPHRIKSPCPHFKRCGGCVFQHISYDLELVIKKNHVTSCMKKANVENASVLEPLSTGKTSFYRNKAQFPVGQREDGSLFVGFYSHKSHTICEIDSCRIGNECFSAIAHFLCEFLTEKKITAYRETEGAGLLRHIYLRRGEASGEVMLTLVLTEDHLLCEKELISDVTSRFPEIKSIVFNINPENTNVILGEKSRVIFGEDKISDVLLNTRLALSHKSFYQVNHDGAELLYQTAFEMANLTGFDLVIDLFCGIGSISLATPGEIDVVGVEIVEEAVENAIFNARENGRENARFMTGDANAAFAFLRKEKAKNPLLVVDPPRKGLSPTLISDIAENKIKTVLYISCGPDSLARDLRLFQEKGYSVSPIQPLDLFPRTGHIECVALLKRHSDINS